MNRHLLLRLYPRAWRERYGEELSAHLAAQRPLRIGVVADVVRGALDAHLHPLRRVDSTMRSSSVSDLRTIAARATVVWSPVAAVAIAAVMALNDFWFGQEWWLSSTGGQTELAGGITLAWYRCCPGLPGRPQVTLAPYDGSSGVRFVPYDQLHDLALQLAVLAVALAGALIFAAMARKTLRDSEPRAS